MNLIADESLDFPIILALRVEGHSVYSILENHPGEEDEPIIKSARTQENILITCDKDFGELVYRLKHFHSGIILLRLAGMDIQKKIQIVLSAINTHGEEFPNSFTVITRHSIRIRKS